jgi:hypothetical protein
MERGAGAAQGMAQSSVVKYYTGFLPGFPTPVPGTEDKRG